MRNTYVPPVGPRNADIMIVGEQPGKREVQRRRPFVGPAGMELDKCLQAARIVRSQCYLTNVFKDLDYPLNHYLEHKKSGTYLSKDGEVYLEELKKEIESVNPNIIIGVGNVPLYALAGRWGITNWRGSILESTLVRGKKVITTFHPATVIPPKMQYLNERLIIFDLIRAREESSFEEIRRAERNIRINPTYFEAVEFLNKCFEEGLRGSLINFDIEVYREEVSCISFAYNEFESMSIPFIGFEGDYFDVSQETEIWKLIAKILEDERIKKLNQNIAFDSAYLLQYVGIKVKNVEDTMIAQKILYPDYPAGLDFITSMYTDLPYYKGEGKKWFKLGGGWKQLWHYNGLDSIACKAAFPKQLVDLDKQKNLETYKRQRNIIEPLVFMMTRGIKVDVEGLFKKREEMIKEYNKTLNELNEIAGCELNPKAPKQLSWYFYTKLGLKPYMKNGRVTTDDKALSRLARKGVREAALIQRLRHLNKITSTYITERKISDDGRIRCSYNPVGAKTGRLSSSEDIHGRGMNLQNWPHDLLTYLIADEGYVFYNVDLSQAENRIVAYVGRVERMIQAFENEEDVHKLTAGLIFNKPPNEISSEDFSSGIGSYSERFIGKKSNHCVLAKTTDVLTPSGWVNIGLAYANNLPIAQWDKGKISFVYPSSWFFDNYSGPIITVSNTKFFQQGTPNHRMPLLREKTELRVKQLRDYPRNGHEFSPLSGEYSGNVKLPDWFIKLLVAFQADGHWDGDGINIKVYKKRKIDRLTEILSKCECGKLNKSGFYLSAKSHITKQIRLLLGREKLFGPWLLELCGENLDVFLDELKYWDGEISRNEYFTTKKQNAEWVQTIAHLRNKACNIAIQDNSKNSGAFGNGLIYRCKIRNVTNISSEAVLKLTSIVDNEPIICPTVDSGFFIVRENGRISVTGNSLNYDLGYRNFSLILQIPENQGKWLVNRYHSIYPEIRNNYHAIIRAQLRKDRTLTNLMGRKRLFLERWGDTLFKDAYAHIPQSTVADIINERGLSYIYNEFDEVILCMQVHDSIAFLIPLSLNWNEHARILLDIKEKLETPLNANSMEFVIPADFKIGINLGGGMREIKHAKMPNDIKKLGELLEFNYKLLVQ